jgi:hypothetical protein
MTEYLQALSMYVLPVVVFMLGLAFIYREYLNHRASLLEKEITLLKASKASRANNNASVAPAIHSGAQFDTLRIQAYERLVLYMERITPGALILRLHQAGMSSKLLRADMAKTVREELEHNLSQQIYVSDKAWKMVILAKDETINLLNIAQDTVGEKASGMELSRVIFEILDKVGKAPNEDALKLLCQEARDVLNG